MYQEAQRSLEMTPLDEYDESFELLFDNIEQFIYHSTEEFGLKKRIADSITLNTPPLTIQSFKIAWKQNPYIAD